MGIVRKYRFGMAACAVLGWTSIGCERAKVSVPEVRPAVAAFRVDEAVRPAAHTSEPAASEAAHWAADAIFYQIFTERFANGDPSNDPTRDSLDYPEAVPDSWSISDWTGDWYARADWEQEMGSDFYDNGVFHRRFGGDLQGVLDRLNYLESLGINAIYFNPLFYARSLHKYDGSSFHHIDPHFGPDPAGDLALIAEETIDPASWHWTAADKLFLQVIQQAHARGIRVVIDGVFNHTGRDFFAFADLRRHQAKSRYQDWYIVQTLDDPNTLRNEFHYRGWWGFDSLPEFADSDDGGNLHPGPKQYIFDITRRWMDPDGDRETSDGIDGWRLDVANEVPFGFWREWHAHVRQIDPDCYTVAEIWDEAGQLLNDAGFSAVMNFHAFSFPVKGFVIDGVLSPSEAKRQLNARRAEFSPATQRLLLNLIDCHDTDRVASMIVNAGRRPYTNPARFEYDVAVSPRYAPHYELRKPNLAERQVHRLLALLQMTYMGPPMIYYGTEAGMWGADDPCDRMPMVWSDLVYDEQQADPLGRPRRADSVEFDAALHDYYRAAIELRRHFPALRRGSIEFVSANDRARFLAFERADDSQRLLIGMNRGDSEYRWEIPLAAGESLVPVFATSGKAEDVAVERSAASTIVIVPACDGIVLEFLDEQ